MDLVWKSVLGSPRDHPAASAKTTRTVAWTELPSVGLHTTCDPLVMTDGYDADPAFPPPLSHQTISTAERHE